MFSRVFLKLGAGSFPQRVLNAEMSSYTWHDWVNEYTETGETKVGQSPENEQLNSVTEH